MAAQKEWKVPPWRKNLPLSCSGFRRPVRSFPHDRVRAADTKTYFFFFFAAFFFVAFFFVAFLVAFFLVAFFFVAFFFAAFFFAILVHLLSTGFLVRLYG